MNFEVKFDNNEVWVMRAAGVDMKPYQKLFWEILEEKVKLPAAVTCNYFLAEEPVDVRITVLPNKLFNIEVADAGIGGQIRKAVLRYTSGKDAKARAQAEHKTLYARITKILKPDGVTTGDVENDKVTLSRRAQTELMGLCGQIPHTDRHVIYWQFTKCRIPKADRAFVAGWLLKRFAIEKDPCLREDIDTVFLNHSDLILRELADEVIRLIQEPRLGVSRSGMIYLLGKLKHPRAAELIAAVMDEENLAWMALRSLGSLKAKQFEPQVRKYLRDPDSEIRQEAKRALKKMGCAMDKAPPPVHLVKNRKLLPKGLAEWSANLDFEELEPVLKTLAGCVDRGFGAPEAAEVLGVAEETRPEQTRALRFPITANGHKGELWLVIFMDDIDAPDLEIHADAELIKKFESKVELKG
jgi:hypothetical protein